MSQRSFYDHAYLELLKGSHTGEPTLACQVLNARDPQQQSGGSAPSMHIAESRRCISDSVEFCVSLLAELYSENTQLEPSDALLALWRRQTLTILFRRDQ